MKAIIRSHKIIGIFLVAIEIFMVLLVVGSKLSRGRVIQYAEKYPNNTGNEIFYPFIYYGELLMIVLLIIWSILTVILLIDKKLKITSLYNQIGIAGFIGSIIYMQLDPFGVSAYYFD